MARTFQNQAHEGQVAGRNSEPGNYSAVLHGTPSNGLPSNLRSRAFIEQGAVGNLSHAQEKTSNSVPATTIEELHRYEHIIRKGWSTFLEVGQALVIIRNAALYKAAGYTTFEDYCRVQLEWTRSTANRHIWAAEVAGILEPIGSKPSSESQVRFLNGLKPDQVKDAWQEAQKLAGSGEITARIVRKAAAKFKPADVEKKPAGNEVGLLIDDIAAAARENNTALVLELLENLRKRAVKVNFSCAER